MRGVFGCGLSEGEIPLGDGYLERGFEWWAMECEECGNGSVYIIFGRIETGLEIIVHDGYKALGMRIVAK